MGLEQLVAGVGPLVQSLLSDVCDLEDVRYVRVDGEEQPDPTTTIIYRNIPCSYETMTKDQQETFPAGMISASASHFLTFIKNETTLKIASNFIIRVHARQTKGLVVGHNEMIFEQPGKAEYSFSPLLGVGAVLRNQ